MYVGSENALVVFRSEEEVEMFKESVSSSAVFLYLYGGPGFCQSPPAPLSPRRELAPISE
jgi:hypothetical protein